MAKSLLFIPDISGFTKFIQTTEANHSQHVIAELLELLIESNTLDMNLAEVEGDALFFYKENFIPSQEKLLAQIETMFTAFYSHLSVLEKNRICPCNACASAPNLQLKIIVHSGDLQFMEIQGNRKPFGQQVIESHRLLKNPIESDNYVLISESLRQEVGLCSEYDSKLYHFEKGKNMYDGVEISFVYSKIDNNNLNLKTFETPEEVNLPGPPNLTYEKNFSVSAEVLLEYITNYQYRYHWVKGVDKFGYKEDEVTRLGTEHTCSINGKLLDFVTVVKPVEPGQLVYGELLTNPPPIVDKIYQFYIITPQLDGSSKLTIELNWIARSPLKKMIIALFAKRIFKKNLVSAVENLHSFVEGMDHRKSA